MNDIAAQQRTDPLGLFMNRHLAERAARPVPLVEVGFDVTIEAGLAIVAMRRLFRNAGEESAN